MSPLSISAFLILVLFILMPLSFIGFSIYSCFLSILYCLFVIIFLLYYSFNKLKGIPNTSLGNIAFKAFSIKLLRY